MGGSNVNLNIILIILFLHRSHTNTLEVRMELFAAPVSSLNAQQILQQFQTQANFHINNSAIANETVSTCEYKVF